MKWTPALVAAAITAATVVVSGLLVRRTLDKPELVAVLKTSQK